MGAADVRSTIVSYLQSQSWPIPITWYRDMPWIIQGEQWQFTSSSSAAAIGIVHIDSQSEDRISLPAKDGTKAVTYKLSLIVLYQFTIPNGAASGTEDAWVDPLDSVLDAVTNAVRAAPNVNTPAGIGPGTILQWGQDKNSLLVERDVPRISPGRVHTWNRVEVPDVTQIIQA